MIKLPQSVKYWKTDLFNQTLKSEIAKINSTDLLIQNACTQGGVFKENSLSITVLAHDEDTNTIFIKIGLFFSEIVPSCSCGDDPLEINNYCECNISINKINTEATLTLMDN